jgi:hypothetical protein
MKYDDTYRREEGVWRFSSRTIQFLYYVPATEFANGLNNRQRLHIGGEAHPADFPEELQSWRDFEHQHIENSDKDS